ncbi:hypothetical protein DFS33DRAFT_1455286 [Desarmillaria ectypa]|nr:hypothetical protein DFS33DRAFT_1455286 [Desarmillaria ectypa]
MHIATLVENYTGTITPSGDLPAFYQEHSFKESLPGAVAFDDIYDVNNVTSTKVDDMEGLRYLTFDDQENINIDDYIFNTEAHPLKVSVPLARHGSGALVPKKPFKSESGPPATVVADMERSV